MCLYKFVSHKPYISLSVKYPIYRYEGKGNILLTITNLVIKVANEAQ